MLPTARSLAAAAALSCAAALPAGALADSTAVPPPAQVTSRNAPVTISGLWCGAGLLHSYALDIAQQYQRVEARLTKRGRVYPLTGRMEGAILRADPQRDHTIDLRAEGNELRIIDGTGILAMAKGQFFTRAVGGSCTH